MRSGARRRDEAGLGTRANPRQYAVRLRPSRLARQLSRQPRARQFPVAHHALRRNLQHFAGLLDSESPEEPQLDHLRAAGINLRQRRQGVLERADLGARIDARRRQPIQRDSTQMHRVGGAAAFPRREATLEPGTGLGRYRISTLPAGRTGVWRRAWPSHVDALARRDADRCRHGPVRPAAPASRLTGDSQSHRRRPVRSQQRTGVLARRRIAGLLRRRRNPACVRSVSPDGTRITFSLVTGVSEQILVSEIDGRSPSRRLTFEGNNRYPIWSSDGIWIAFQSDRSGDQGIFRQRADGTGTAERITTAPRGVAHVPDSWSRDGKSLFFNPRPEGFDFVSLTTTPSFASELPWPCTRGDVPSRSAYPSINASTTLRATAASSRVCRQKAFSSALAAGTTTPSCSTGSRN